MLSLFMATNLDIIFNIFLNSSFQVSYKGNIIEEAHILAETLLHTTK